jgi:outer membrane protein assembly factor BamB
MTEGKGYMPAQESGQSWADIPTSQAPGSRRSPDSRPEPREPADSWPPPRRYYPERTWTAVLTCAAVVVLVVVAALAAGNKGTSPGQSEAAISPTRPLWSTSVPVQKVNLYSAVTDGNVVAVATGTAVTGYSLGSGKQAWRWNVPSGSTACSVSPTVSKHIMVVEYGANAASTCGTLTAVDLSTGRPAWRSPAHLTIGAGAYTDSTPYLDGDAVVASDPAGNIEAFDLADGSHRWTTASTAPYLNNPAGCELTTGGGGGGNAAVADGSHAYGFYECEPSQRTYIYPLNLSTGRPGAAIPAASPCAGSIDGNGLIPVAGYLVEDCDTSQSHFLLLKLGDSHQTPFTISNPGGNLPDFLASSHTLYAGIAGDTDEGSAVDAIDTASGALAWQYRPQSTYTTVSVLGVDARGVQLVEAIQPDTDGVPWRYQFRLETIPVGSRKPVTGTSVFSSGFPPTQFLLDQGTLTMFTEPDSGNSGNGSLTAYARQSAP